ncbi:MAG: 3-deoxy-manno-octulosonate cytidylyltransferase [Thermodesulfobacteriota bacterium]
MRVVAVIPSRYGSTRFAAKPLADIAGKSMIRRVYERTARSATVSETVVATDDRRIADAVEGFGGRAVLTSESCRSGTDRAAEAARILGLAKDDIVVNVQGDQPLVHPESVDEVAAPFFTEAGLNMTTLAFEIVRPEEIVNPKDVKVVFDNQGFALYFSRSPVPCSRDRDVPFATYKHLGLYAYTRRFLEVFAGLSETRLEAIEKLEQLRALEHGYRIKVVVTRHDSPEVDVPADIVRIAGMIRADER